jgi:hypothetical protein
MSSRDPGVPHDHREYVEGCFRCELSSDEVAAAERNERLSRLNGPIHGWFNLTYANYLTLPRAILQSMSVDWQEQFVACLEELHQEFGHLPWPEGGYRVQPIDARGRFTRDAIPHYDRGRTFIPPKEEDGS